MPTSTNEPPDLTRSTPAEAEEDVTESPAEATADPSSNNEELSGTYVPSASEWVRDQVETYERTGGQEANTLLDTGIPVIIVTMRGAKTGDVRKIALMRVEHHGDYALVASAGGAPKHPVWYWNLTAHPDEVLIQDGPKPFRVSVREVEGDERAAWWDRAVAVYPPYAEYQAKTDRVIPVLVAATA
jgi:F420H(2)-dependent quinone reductase